MCDRATFFLQNRPGTDVAFYNGMLHVLLAEGLFDEAYVAKYTTGEGALSVAYNPAVKQIYVANRLRTKRTQLITNIRETLSYPRFPSFIKVGCNVATYPLICLLCGRADSVVRDVGDLTRRRRHGQSRQLRTINKRSRVSRGQNCRAPAMCAQGCCRWRKPCAKPFGMKRA